MDTKIKKRGRPSGLFEYNKLRLLHFLQQNTPYIKNMESLRADVAATGLDVCQRQLCRYLHDLEREITDEGMARVSIVKTLVREQQGDTRLRVLICNDKRSLNF